MDTVLKSYSLSDNGFLPHSLPLACLPDAYYAPWESIIVQLPTLLHNGVFRQHALELPVLSTDRLTSEPEWQRAYVVLTFFTNAYIWGGDAKDEAAAADVLPPAITVPLLAVSAHLELPPVATYAALNLWNFTTTTPDAPFDDLDSLRALHTFTGTESESWFYVVSVAMECRAAAIVPVLLDAMQEGTASTVATSALRQFIACIQDVGRLLERMHERCDPSTFFWKIRPFLAGSKNMAPQGLPNGVFYDEALAVTLADTAAGRPVATASRGSNGQSSLLQFFDIVLGVEHRSNGTAAVTSTADIAFHEEVRGYMPGRTADSWSTSAQCRHSKMPAAASHDEHMRSAFQDATEALAAFRNKHLAIVTRYIILPSKQKRPADSANGVARGLAGTPQAMSKPEPNSERFTGTGGTSCCPFSSRRATKLCRQGISRAFRKRL